jgi:hypothetical protein
MRILVAEIFVICIRGMKWFRRNIPVMAWLLVAAATSLGQPAPDIVPECTASDLDVSFKFMNGPDADESVAINFRNVSESACVLRGGSGAMFNDVRHGHNIWTKECRNCSSDGGQLFPAPLTLAPGETGYFLLRWKNASVDGSGPCQEAGGFNTNVNSDIKHLYLVVAPSLLGDICSVVKADSYLPGFFADKRPLPENGQRTEPSASIKLDSSSSTLYAGDSFSFFVSVNNPNGQLPTDNNSCPVTFIRTRSAGGDTALEEISPYTKCTSNSSADGRSRLITMVLRATGLGVLNQLGSTSVQVQALAGPAHAQEVAMVASNELDLNIVDPATMSRAWGPQIKGVAVSLALDKENYEIGQDIPLRMAVENFSAARDIESGELPCGAGVTIEVRDSAGKEVTAQGGEMVCMGHGWLIGYPKGKVVPLLGMTLRGLGILPDHADSYTVVAAWNALAAVDGAPSGTNLNSNLEPYAVAHSIPATFRVLKTH